MAEGAFSDGQVVHVVDAFAGPGFDCRVGVVFQAAVDDAAEIDVLKPGRRQWFIFGDAGIHLMQMIPVALHQLPDALENIDAVVLHTMVEGGLGDFAGDDGADAAVHVMARWATAAGVLVGPLLGCVYRIA